MTRKVIVCRWFVPQNSFQPGNNIFRFSAESVSAFIRRISLRISSSTLGRPLGMHERATSRPVEIQHDVGNHSIRIEEDQGLRPVTPETTEHNPEQPIESIQFGAGLLAFLDG
jgi:hypothetical protein